MVVRSLTCGRHGPSCAFAAASPSLPSKVFTSASHGPSTWGFCFRYARAASAGLVLFITPCISWFSNCVEKRNCVTSLPAFGQRCRIAAGQVIEAELDIHRMRLPPPNPEPLLVADRTLERDQHPGLAGFDQLEAAKPVQVLVDHLLYLRVGTAARLDPVDLAVELLAV